MKSIRAVLSVQMLFMLFLYICHIIESYQNPVAGIIFLQF